jgi:hypothetical protein
MAEWLGDGLQNRIHGFNSHSRLQFLQTARQRFVKKLSARPPHRHPSVLTRISDNLILGCPTVRMSLRGSGGNIFLLALPDLGTATKVRKIPRSALRRASRRSPPGSRRNVRPKGASLSIRTARLRASLLRRGRLEPGGLRRFSRPEPHTTVTWYRPSGLAGSVDPAKRID